EYALAVCYCYLRGGRLPFADTPPDFQVDYVRPNPDLSMLEPGEAGAVARALAPMPQDRWPSCRDLIADLQKTACPPAAAPSAVASQRSGEARSVPQRRIDCELSATLLTPASLP